MRLMMWRIPAHLRTDTGEAVPFSLAVLLSEESAAFHVSAEPSPSSRQQPSTDAALEEPQKQIWPRRTDLPLHRRSCRSSGNKRSCPQPGFFIRLNCPDDIRATSLRRTCGGAIERNEIRRLRCRDRAPCSCSGLYT